MASAVGTSVALWLVVVAAAACVALPARRDDRRVRLAHASAPPAGHLSLLRPLPRPRPRRAPALDRGREHLAVGTLPPPRRRPRRALPRQDSPRPCAEPRSH